MAKRENRADKQSLQSPLEKCEAALTSVVQQYLGCYHDEFLKNVPKVLETFKQELGDKNFATLEARVICARLVYLSQPGEEDEAGAINILSETADYLSEVDVSSDDSIENLRKVADLKVFANSLLQKCLSDESEQYFFTDEDNILKPSEHLHSVHVLLAQDMTLGYVAFRRDDYLNAFAYLGRALQNREAIGWGLPHGKKGMEYCRSCLDLIETTSADLMLATISLRFEELDRAEFFAEYALHQRGEIYPKDHLDMIRVDNLLRMIRARRRDQSSEPPI